MIYTIPYVILILVYGCLSTIYTSKDIAESKKRELDIICIAIMLFFFGFRGYICDDWQTYYQNFRDVSIYSLSFNLFQGNTGWVIEPGFTLLMLIVKSIFNDFRFLVFICTLINTMLLYRFLHKRIDNIALGFMIYICMGGFGMNTNMMRNSISILIFANALEFIEKRKAIPYFAMCFLAFLFHRSSIFYFPLYFFLHKKCNKWIYLSIIVIGNIIVLLQIPIVTKLLSFFSIGLGNLFDNKVDSYSNGHFDNTAYRISIGYLERVFSAIIFFCYYDKLISIRKENIIFLNSFLGFFIAYFFLSEMDTLSARMSYLFTYAYWILWIDLLKCFSIENNRKLFSYFIMIYCVFKIMGSTNFITAQYDNILFGAKSYDERLFIYNRNHD